MEEKEIRANFIKLTYEGPTSMDEKGIINTNSMVKLYEEDMFKEYTKECLNGFREDVLKMFNTNNEKQ